MEGYIKGIQMKKYHYTYPEKFCTAPLGMVEAAPLGMVEAARLSTVEATSPKLNIKIKMGQNLSGRLDRGILSNQSSQQPKRKARTQTRGTLRALSIVVSLLLATMFSLSDHVLGFSATTAHAQMSEPLIRVSGGPIALLAVGDADSTTFSGACTLTQDDINAGMFENMVTAQGMPPSGSVGPLSEPILNTSDDPLDPTDDNPNSDGNPDDPTTTAQAQAPAIGLEKTGTFMDESGDEIAQVGETISYLFKVENIGNVDIINVSISDTLISVVGSPLAVLAVGESDSTTFSGSYTLTAADIAAGGITNLATAEGTDPDGNPVRDDSDDPTNPTDADPNGDGNPDDPTFTPLAPQPQISLLKQGSFNDESGDGVAQAGETISYLFTVLNTGNVDLTNVTVSDPMVTVSGEPIALLAVGDNNNITFSATYTLTIADIAAGGVSNLATATGDDPNGNLISDDSDDPKNSTDADPNGDGNPDDPTFTSLAVPQPGISLLKQGRFNDESGDGIAQAGETISYLFTVLNTGNVDLTNVTVSDPLVTVNGKPIELLVVGASDDSNFSATYTLTVADIAAGGVSNVATATGDDPNGNPISDDSDDPKNPTDADPNGDGNPDDPTFMPLVPQPEISLLKQGSFNDENGDGFAQAGETISYLFTVLNTGNVDLTNVTVSDSLATVNGEPIELLAVSASDDSNFSATYTLTVVDIAAGGVSNVATATADDPNGNPVRDDSDDPTNSTDADPNGDGNPDDPTFMPLALQPKISLLKQGSFNDENDDGFAQAGETISYLFTVLNTGNVDLTNVTVSDPLATVNGEPIALLAAGASDNSRFSATYTLTVANLIAGGVSNLATVTGDDPNSNPVSDDSDDPTNSTNADPNGDGNPDDPTFTPLAPKPEISLLKRGSFNDENGDGVAQVGETITYAFMVTNISQIDLINITVSDALIAVNGGPLATLAVGDSNSTTFSGRYTLQQADLDEGKVENSAIAKGTDTNGNPVTDISDDPKNPADVDPNGDGNPDDPTVIPLAAGSSFNSFYWLDEDADGIRDATEAPIVGATVILLDSNGNTIAQTVADVNGSFEFNRLPVGVYQLQFILPEGFNFTQPNATGGPNSGVDEQGFMNITLGPGSNDIETGAGVIAEDQESINPKSIILSSFTAELRNDTELVVRWQTDAEVDTSGFHLLLSENRTLASAFQITNEIILSQGSAGGSYKMVLPYDQSSGLALQQATVWLYEVEKDQSINYYGPALVQLDAARHYRSIFLPTINLP